MDTREFRALIPESLYDPSEIVLIGSHMFPSPKVSKVTGPDGTTQISLSDDNRTDLSCGHMRVRSDFVSQLNLKAEPARDQEKYHQEIMPTMALVYAYGYEGHSYRLPKPRIMILNGYGEPYEPAGERGQLESLTGELYMWRHSKHDQTVSIEVESGDLEKLVLEANQPGNRAVNSYAAHMQMSHRGGKLS